MKTYSKHFSAAQAGIFFLLINFILSFSLVQNAECGQNKNKPGTSFTVKVVNPLKTDRTDQLVSIPVKKIKIKLPGFDLNTAAAFDGKNQIPVQIEDLNGDKIPDNLLILVDIKKNEKKNITVNCGLSSYPKKDFKKRTQAVIETKVDYTMKEGYYTGGRFQSTDRVEMPATHFAHDAFIKFEGPGWESDKVAYRFYLDSRNRNDIFAKKIDDVVLQRVGNSDLVSDSKESYTKMCDWGMDVFKVGESLGIGSIASLVNGKVAAVSKTDKVFSQITADGIIKSDLRTIYSGWQTGESKIDLTSLKSITAGSRLTKEEISFKGKLENICTGLAKHEGCPLITDSKKNEWSYIASYGKQSLAGDNLGLALFFRRADLIKITEDDVSLIVILKPVSGKVNYYFAAAPEMELNGIKSKEDFIKYLDSTAMELSNPLRVEL